jgi:PST family polysaccharide transporter
MTTHKKRIIDNFISLSVVQGLSILFPLIIFPYLVRILGVEGFGVFSLIQAVIMYADLLVSFGFGLSATKAIARNVGKEIHTNNVISAVFFIKIILFVIPIVLFLLSALFVPMLRDQFVYLLIAALFLLGNILFPDWYFQGIQKMRSITVVTFISKCISFLLIIFFVKQPEDIVFAVFAVSIGNFIAGLIGFFLLLKSFSWKFTFAPKRFVKAFFKESAYVFSSIILVPLYSTINLFILQYFTNPLMVGYYAISEKIYSALSMLTSVANRTFYPHLTQLYKTSQIGFENNVKKLSVYFALGFTTLAIAQFFGAEFIVRFLSGKHNIQDVDYAVDILRIMSIAVMFSPFGSFYFQLLIIQGRKKTAVRNISSVVLINMVTAASLAYFFQGKGMAVNLCIIVFFIALFNYYSYRYKSGFNKIQQ